MNLIDLHQDILLHQNKPETYPAGFRNQTSLQQVAEAGADVVVASGFAVPESGDLFSPEANEILEQHLKTYRQFCNQREKWTLITNADDLQSVLQENDQHGLIFHIEALNAFSGAESEWERLGHWYELGWRSVGIVWNKTNNLGGGTHDPKTGLRPLGEEVLRWAESRNMVIDCAHMNQRTFVDTLELTSKPLIVSHGNARSVINTPRNYTDGQIKAIAERNGVIGVFLSATNLAKKQATVDDVVQHIDHIASLVGIDHVALGTDFGGLTGDPVEEMKKISDIVKLRSALKDHGFNKAEVRKIFHGNAQRTITNTLT